MRNSAAILVIGAGAILAFAVTTNTSVLDLHTTGFVLIFIGLLGLFLPRGRTSWLTRRLVRKTRWWPGGGRVEETTRPSYVVRSPRSQRVKAGLPTGTPAPSSEVVEEDIYER